MKPYSPKSWLNTTTGYGRLSIALHWISALLVFGLFASGFWMVSLTYYDPLYRTVPYYHKSTGVIFFLLIMIRLYLRMLGQTVHPTEELTPFERLSSTYGHRLLYVGMVVVPILGYGISTADGRSVEVFGIFTLPALPYTWPNQEDTLGWLHEWGAYALVSLAIGHGAMAIWHGPPVWNRMWIRTQHSRKRPHP